MLQSTSYIVHYFFKNVKRFLKKVCIIWKLREILDLMNFKKGAWRRAVQHLGERSGSELSAHAPVVQMLF